MAARFLATLLMFNLFGAVGFRGCFGAGPDCLMTTGCLVVREALGSIVTFIIGDPFDDFKR
jgi:hypothetical protein